MQRLGSRLERVWNQHHRLVSVLLIVILALGLRLWGIDYGLPYDYLPDESKHVKEALEIIVSGDFNPHYFKKGSLYLYFLAAIYIPYFLYGASKGVFTTVADLLPNGSLKTVHGTLAFPTELLVGRIAIAVLGTLTILLTYLIGKKYYNHRTGLVVALFLAVSPLHAVARSHGINADVPVTLLITLSFLFACEILRTGGRKNYILTGLLGGLAVSVKYNGYIVLAPLLVAHLLRGDVREQLNNLVWGLLAFGFGFWSGTPYSLLDLPTFLNEVAVELRHYSTGHFGFEGNSRWWYTQRLIQDEIFSPVLALGTIAYTAFRRGKIDILMACFPALYFLMISSYTVHFARNLLPLLPFTALLAGRFIDVVISALGARFSLSARKQLGLWGLLAAIFIARPLYMTSLLNTWLVQRKDVRTIAAAWIAENIPPGSSVWMERYGPPLSRATFTVAQTSGKAIDHPPEWYGQEGFDYVILSPMVYDRAFEAPQQYATEVERYQTIFREFTLVKEIEGWKLGNITRGTMKIYQVPYFLSHFSKAEVEPNWQPMTATANSEYRGVSNLSIDDVVKPTLYQRPMPEGEVGLIYRAVEIQPDTALRFSVGLDPQVYSSDKGDGVTFRLYVSQQGAFTLLFAKYIDPKNNPADRKWHDFVIDLTALAGQQVDFKFATTPGIANNDRYDWAHWGSPRFINSNAAAILSATVVTASLIEYAAPTLLMPEDGANATDTVSLQWRWDEALQENEYFDVRVWQEGKPHLSIAWTKERQYKVKLNDLGESGKYYWSIAVIRGQNGVWESDLSPEATARSLMFSTDDVR